MRFRVNSMQIGTLCSAYAAFHLGNIMKVVESRNANVLNNHRRLFGVLSVGVLVCLLAYNTQEIRLINNQIINPYYYLTAACSGWFMIRVPAFILIDNCMLILRIFVYIGKKSMYILCCHLLSFKIVAVLQCMVNKDFSGIANIDMIAPIRNADGSIPVFTDTNKFISADTEHLTKNGCIYYSQKLDLSFIK